MTAGSLGGVEFLELVKKKSAKYCYPHSLYCHDVRAEIKKNCFLSNEARVKIKET